MGCFKNLGRSEAINNYRSPNVIKVVLLTIKCNTLLFSGEPDSIQLGPDNPNYTHSAILFC